MFRRVLFVSMFLIASIVVLSELLANSFAIKSIAKGTSISVTTIITVMHTIVTIMQSRLVLNVCGIMMHNP